MCAQALKKYRSIVWFAVAIFVFLSFFIFNETFISRLSKAPLFHKNFENHQTDEFFIGNVTRIQESEGLQNIDVILESQEVKNEIITVNQGEAAALQENEKVRDGERVIVTRTFGGPRQVVDYLYDRYRLSSVIVLTLIFLFLAAALGGKRGFYSILGLAFSIFVLIEFIIPQILSGKNPLTVSILGSVVIACVSMFLSHGFNKKTSVALGSTIITLGIAGILSVIFVSFAKLSGMATEEVFYLQMDFADLNARGLLLGGIVIGALGVLDDITSAQAATVQEIAQANPRLQFVELYRRGIAVGKEHIASLVNTLVLAYAGASFPLLLLFKLDKNIPFWVNLNNEYIVEEIIRTLVGSTALLFAVPITTFLAAYFLQKRKA